VVFFHREQRDLIESGQMRVTYRDWQSPHVRVGGRYGLGVGSIVIEDCDLVPASEIGDEEAREAGFPDRETLLAVLAHRRSASEVAVDSVYRIAFRYEAAPPPSKVETERLTDHDAALLMEKLDGLDARGAYGPWTWDVLHAVAENPGLRARELAALFDRELLSFKADIRKLKRLGLTLSLDVGYEISPRGQALLDRQVHASP
jgi:hypothetical protein